MRLLERSTLCEVKFRNVSSFPFIPIKRLHRIRNSQIVKTLLVKSTHLQQHKTCIVLTLDREFTSTNHYQHTTNYIKTNN